MRDWYVAGLEDDMRPRMFAAAARGEAFALATIVSAEGGGPRGVGAQMFITTDEMAGFLSGGCIEADVAIHGRQALDDGEPRRLAYGTGSPFVDTRLPCGGRLDILIERVGPDDGALRRLAEASAARRSVTLISDGRIRQCLEGDVPSPERLRAYAPRQRLIVIGTDAFGLAIAEQGLIQGWEVFFVRPNGPETPPPLALAYRRDMPAAALQALKPDAWTAVAVATHDTDLDHDALSAALASDAGYVGVMGARRRLPERIDRLGREAGVGDRVARLHAPIGIPIAARSPHEIATSVIAEIIGSRL